MQPTAASICTQATGFQQLEQGDLVNPGRFHSHGGNAALLQPVGDGDEVAGIGPEPANVRWQTTWLGRRCCAYALDRNADHVHVRMHIDAGRVGVEDGHHWCLFVGRLLALSESLRCLMVLTTLWGEGTEPAWAKRGPVECSFPNGINASSQADASHQ